jgi:hypothetical protein
MVDALTRWPSLSNSPWILLYPQPLFSVASRSISVRGSEIRFYVENIRPRFGYEGHPALWVTERGGRIKRAEINARFVAYRDALVLPKALVVHSMRHSYVSHLTENGVDRRFIQAGQVVPGACGHLGQQRLDVGAGR